MADTRISALSSVAPADADSVAGVDASDTTQSAQGTTKRFLFSAIWTYISGKIGTIGALAAKNTVAAVDIDADAVTTVKILDANVTLAKQANVATARIMGRVTAGTGVQEAMTGTQATTLLDLATATLKGLLPAWPNNTTTFFRGDGTYADPLVGSLIGAALDTLIGHTRWSAQEVPAAGTTGQVLKKISATDYNYSWQDDTGGAADLSAVAEDILPDADSTRDIGSATFRWAEGHFDVLDLNGTTITGATIADPGADAIATWDDSATAGTEYGFGTYGQGLTQVGRNPQVTDNVMFEDIAVTIGNGVDVITTGVWEDFATNIAGNIVAATVVADASGSVVLDIWKRARTSGVPTVSHTIVASAKPTLTAAQSSLDTTLTGWTASVAADDWWRINVDSASTVKRVTLTLKVKKT